MERQEHWENIYSTKGVQEVSWFRDHLEPSLRLIEAAHLGSDASIIDVGGGASTLVDDLLERGYRNVTVLDISSAALDRTRERLGDRADSATWVVADVTQVALPENAYDLWHDRAVFHFLTSRTDRVLYIKNLKRALKPNGHLIMASFSDDGPLKCSGLEVERYSIGKLIETLGADFTLLSSFSEVHQTPFNTKQNFLYAHFQLRKSLEQVWPSISSPDADVLPRQSRLRRRRSYWQWSA